MHQAFSYDHNASSFFLGSQGIILFLTITMHYPFYYDHNALSFFLGSQCIKLFFSFKLVLWAQISPSLM
jgi:hypothetical protein